MSSDLTELLERSSEEAALATDTADPEAAARHQEQCLLYTSRAMAALIERRVAFPFARAA